MKQSLLIFSILFLFAFQAANAQVAKGSLMVGGTAGFTTEFREDSDNLFSLTINPSVSKFFTDELAVGGAIGITYQKLGESSASVVNILPTVRYYFTGFENNPAFFGQAQIGLALINQKFGDESDSENALQYALGAGMSFFITENASIDALLAYNRIGGDFDIGSFGLSVGFQVFLNNGE
ncbi:MAG: opacity protein-like surface antigen [Polaribacter sp.]|jgi:opacity protein-like surface antigen